MDVGFEVGVQWPALVPEMTDLVHEGIPEINELKPSSVRTYDRLGKTHTKGWVRLKAVEVSVCELHFHARQILLSRPRSVNTELLATGNTEKRATASGPPVA